MAWPGCPVERLVTPKLAGRIPRSIVSHKRSAGPPWQAPPNEQKTHYFTLCKAQKLFLSRNFVGLLSRLVRRPGASPLMLEKRNITSVDCFCRVKKTWNVSSKQVPFLSTSQLRRARVRNNLFSVLIG